MRVTRTICLGLAATTALSVTAPVHAQSLDDKYWVEISGYWPDLDSHVRIQSKVAPAIATEIDLESDLALSDRKTLPAVTAGVRLGRRWVLGAEYYTLSRTATRALQRDIVFDDVTYRLGASVSSKFDSDIYRLTVGYDFIRHRKFQLGAALGFHVTDFDIELSGQASANASGVATVRKHQLLAPLPTIGASGSAKLVPRLTLSGRFDWLQIKIGDYDGRLINTQAALTYRFLKNVGLGVAYRYVDYRLNVDKDRWNGRLTYRFNGPAVFLQVGF